MAVGLKFDELTEEEKRAIKSANKGVSLKSAKKETSVPQKALDNAKANIESSVSSSKKATPSKPAKQERNTVAVSVNTKPTVALSAKAVSSKDKEDEKRLSPGNHITQTQARQKTATGVSTLEGDRYTAPNKSFMTRYESAKEYLESPGKTAGDSIAKGLWNRFRSVPGETVEDLAYLIKDFAPGYKPAQKVIEANTAGQVATLADEQLSEAKDETGNVGDFLIDAADAGTRMLSNAAFFGKGNIAASQAAGGGLSEYRSQRETGATKADAFSRGAGNAAASYFLEKSGGIGGKAKGSIIKAVVPGTNTLDTKTVASFFKNIVQNAAQEGGEEFAESVASAGIDYIADAVFRGEVTIDFSLIDALRSAGIGAILGAGYGATNAAASKVADTYYNSGNTPDTEVNAVQPEAPNPQSQIPSDIESLLRNLESRWGVDADGVAVAPQAEATETQNAGTTPDVSNEAEIRSLLESIDRQLRDRNAQANAPVQQNEPIQPVQVPEIKPTQQETAQASATGVTPEVQNVTEEAENIQQEPFANVPEISVQNTAVTAPVETENAVATRTINPELSPKRVERLTERIGVLEKYKSGGYASLTPSEKTVFNQMVENGILASDNVDEAIGYLNSTLYVNSAPEVESGESVQTAQEKTNADTQPIPQTSVRAQNDVTGARRKASGAQEEIQYVSEDAQDYVREDEGYEGGAHPNTVGSQQSQNKFYKALNDYGAQPLRKEQIAKGNYFEIPKKLSDTEAMSEDVGYMAGSELGDNDFMDDVIQHPEKYAHQINTDTASMQKAIDDIQKYGLDAAYGDFEGKIDNGKMIEKDDITKAAMTALFYQEKAQTETDPQRKEEYRKRSLEIKTDITYAATKGGQLLQSIQMLQKLVGTNGISLKADGEYMAQRLCDRLNEQRNGKGKEIVLNKDLVDAAVKAAGTDAEGKAWDEVYKDLANQTSTGFWQRLNNYRYWCMLSNPRTHVRNIFSNISMVVVNAVKDVTKAPVEALYNAYVGGQNKRAAEVDAKIEQLIAQGNKAEADKLSEKSKRLHRFDNAKSKTTAIYKKEDFSYAWNDFKNARKVYDTVGKYSDSASGFIREYKTNANSDPITTALSKKIEGNNKVSEAIKEILEHGAFGSVMDFNSWMLMDVEDGAFKQITYAHELAQRMKANGITAETATRPENTAKMEQLRAEAFAEALYNTFNEDSKVAKILQKAAKDSKVLHVGIEAMLPFKKVPVNIVKTGLDYSPLGLAKGIAEISKVMANPDKGNANKALNDLAKGLTGAELIALGAFLRSIGKITNGLSDDDDEKNFQKLLGEQAFALKFNDGSSYSIEWLGSSVMPLFTGALAYDMLSGEIGDKLKIKNTDGETDWNKVAELSSGVFGLLSSVTNPMIEMSMLSNIEYALTSQYNNIDDFLIDTLGDYANQFVPQFVSAITKTADNTKRNAYYVDKTDYIPDKFQKPVQMAMSKIPGLSKKLGAQVDGWGREKTHSDRETAAGRVFDAFLSPGTYKKDKTTEADRLIAQLVADTGYTNIYPSSPQKNITIDKNKFNLSASEYEQLAKDKGQLSHDIVSQLTVDKSFARLTPEEQAKTISQAYEYATAKSKTDISKTVDGKEYTYKLPAEWGKLENSVEETGISEGTYLSYKVAASGIEKTDTKSVSQILAKQLIADKNVTASQGISILGNIQGIDTEKYVSATAGNKKKALEVFEAIGGDGKKEPEIEKLKKMGYSEESALAVRNVSHGSKKYEGNKLKGFSEKQLEKANLLLESYPGETIAKAANAVVSIGDYGTKKNKATCIAMLEAVGIKDEKFQNDFWRIYVNS